MIRCGFVLCAFLMAGCNTWPEEVRSTKQSDFEPSRVAVDEPVFVPLVRMQF